MPKPRAIRTILSHVNVNERLKQSFLYLITPARPKAGPLEEFLPRVLEAGVDMVQLREKEMEARELLGHAEIVRRCTEDFGAIFIVNDRADLAVISGAGGLHVGQEDLSVVSAREILEDGKIVGLSTHSQGEVTESSKEEGPDYIGVGPVHVTPTKEGRAAVGHTLIEFAAEHSKVPFFAIGGIDLETLPGVIEAGARRVSVLRAITEAEEPGGVARRMKQVLLEANP
jgi:thiamine-phosphate pyrophosphorylase